MNTPRKNQGKDWWYEPPNWSDYVIFAGTFVIAYPWLGVAVGGFVFASLGWAISAALNLGIAPVIVGGIVGVVVSAVVIDILTPPSFR